MTREEKPNPYVKVQVVGHSTDYIDTEEGESFEDALKRNRQIQWESIGYVDKNGYWNDYDGFPMVIGPTKWRHINV